MQRRERGANGDRRRHGRGGGGGSSAGHSAESSAGTGRAGRVGGGGKGGEGTVQHLNEISMAEVCNEDDTVDNEFMTNEFKSALQRL